MSKALFRRFHGGYLVKGGVTSVLNAVDEAGDVLWSTTPDPVAPTISSAQVWPEPGYALTITKGSSEPTLTLDGLDVTADAGDNGDGTLIYVAPSAGELVAASADGSDSITVYPATRDEFDISFDRHMAPLGALPASYDAGGRLALTLNEAGASQGLSGQAQVGDEGIIFNGSNLYQRRTGITETFDGAIVVFDGELTTPTATDTILSLDPSGDGAFVLSVNQNHAIIGKGETGTPRFVAASQRVQLAWEYDTRNGRHRWISSNGYLSPWIDNADGGELIGPSDIRIGGASGSTAVDGVLEVFIKLRAPVGDDPLNVGSEFGRDLSYYWQRVARRRYQDKSPTEMLAVIAYGQSNALGGPTGGDDERMLEYMTEMDAVMPADLAGTIRGPGSSDVTGIASSGFVPIVLGGNITMGYGAARVWNGATPDPMTVAVMAAGVGGAAAENLDADPATGDGSAVSFNNFSHILSEMIRLAGLEDKAIPRVAIPFMQGGGNEGMSEAAYQPIFAGLMGDLIGEVQSQGAEPLIWLYQMNGDANRGAGELMAPALVQLAWARSNDCIFIATAPYEIFDGNTHLTGDSQLLLSEIAPRLQIDKDKGDPVPNPIPSVSRDTATQITITIPKRSDMTLSRDAGRYGVPVDHGGLEVEGGGSITNVVLANQTTTATLTVTISGTVTHIRNAMQAGVSPNTAFVTGMTEWFIETGWPSETVSGVDLQHFLPIFRDAV